MVTIRELTHDDGTALAEMLNDDVVLRANLGIRTDDRANADGVIRDVGEWCRSRKGVSYAVLAGDVTVGMMSLSRINPESGTGRIGYWVGSDYRQRGYCARAFELVLQEARRRGLHTVSASVVNDNTASRRVWERAGGTGTPVSLARIRYELQIEEP